MNVAKLVKKYERLILGSIVAVIAISLVVWAFPGGRSNDNVASKPAGSFKFKDQEITVSFREFYDIRQRASIHMRLRPLLRFCRAGIYAGPIIIDQDFFQILFSGRFRIGNFFAKILQGEGQPRDKDGRPREIQDQDLQEVAWDTIIMLKLAEDFGITVNEKEVQSAIIELYDSFSLTREEYTVENYKQMVNFWFQSGLTALETSLKEALIISKLFTVMTDSHFPLLRELYENQINDNRKFRVLHHIVDSAMMMPKITSITNEEIAKEYEKIKDELKTPRRAQILYLAYLFDDFIKQPTDDELKDYYEKNKSQFGTPPEKFEDVKEKIQKKIMDQAKHSLYNLIWTVYNELSTEIKKLPDENRKNMQEISRIAELLKSKYSNLKFDITPMFKPTEIDEIQQTFGKNEQGLKIDFFAFDDTKQEGSIHKSIYVTDKGYFILILNKREEPKQMTLSQAKDLITLKLQKKYADEMAKKLADNISDSLKSAGRTVTEERYKINLKLTDYFSPQSLWELTSEDYVIIEALRYKIDKLSKMGDCVVHTSMKEDKNIYCVLYLDDIYYPPQDDLDEKVKESIKSEIYSKRMEQKDKLFKSFRIDAGLKEFNKVEQPSEQPGG